ncbi:MAG: tandem-95 repeat protein, partial [Phycisphaerae bacterium]
GDLTNGLIGHWALDGDTSDSSDSGNDGTLAGADGDEWVGGEVGSGAASFDGVDDIIQTEDNDSLQLSDDYTISIWINPDSTQNDWAGILSKTNVDGSDNHWTLQFDNSADRNLIIYHPGGGNRWDTGLDLNDIADEWHHITVTRSGTTMSCHLDGELAGSGTFATDPGSGTGHLNIGGDRTGSSSYLYTGEIDDVRVYDHVLGADAIGQLADMGGVTENTAPTAADDAVSTSEDTPVTTGNVLANDSDPDGDALSITGFTQGANGTVVDNGDGTFTYTPNADFSGTDSFTYTVDDGNGGTDTATVNVTVDPADGGGNNAPTDLLITSVQENQPLQTDGAATGVTVVGIYAPGSDVNLLEGKPPLTTLSDHQYFDHSSLGYTGYNYMGSHHWFSDNGVSISGLNGGQVVFSDGTTGVIDAVSNGAGSTENAYVYYRAYDDNVDATINENSPPGTVVATFSATDPDSNESFTYSIADNSDFEVVGNELRVKEGAQMNHEAGASTTVDVTVTDSAGDSYVEAITVHIADVNEAPLNISLVPDLDNPANLTSGAPSGTTVVGIYAPDSGINLLDGQPELTTLSDHAYFDHGSLGHTGYNYMGGHHWFSDNGISISGLQGGKVVFSDGTTGVIDAVSNGAGTTENAYIYYEAYDPTAGINVADGAASGTTVATLGANDPDVGDSVTYAIAGDSDQFEIVGNSILVKDGATLDSEVATSHDITVCVTDAAGLSHNQSFTIYVGDGNHAPTAADDAVSTTEDTAVTTGNVLANDTDPEGDTLSVTGFTQGTNGTVVDNDDGTFTYTPNADFSGNDSFTYTVDDGNGGTDTATVNVTVTPVSQPAPEPEPVEPVGFPHADDFSDGVADGFQAVDGTWAVSDGAYEISGLGNTGDNGVAVLNFDGPLPEAFEIGAQLESDNVSGQYQNGFIIFDYNGPDDFKFAGARVGADYWTVGHYDGSWVNDATLSQPINTGTPYDMHLNVDGGQVTLSVDGVEKVSYDFGEPLNNGQVGLA